MLAKQINNYKKKWRILKELLELEIKLANKVLKKALKDELYSDVLEQDTTIGTVEWVLEEMEHIKETDKCL